jgi:hypothetical protein
MGLCGVCGSVVGGGESSLCGPLLVLWVLCCCVCFRVGEEGLWWVYAVVKVGELLVLLVDGSLYG